MKSAGQIVGHLIDRIETEEKYLQVIDGRHDGDKRATATAFVRILILKEILKYAME